MTSVYVEILNPKELYDTLAIQDELRVDNQTFVEELREELFSSLANYGVKNVSVKIITTKQNQDYYKIIMNNIKNDWQEEQIRIDCDDVCLSFMKKENLTKLKTVIIK
jgi:hypothetical protein